jgi:hypothetical protein
MKDYVKQVRKEGHQGSTPRKEGRMPKKDAKEGCQGRTPRKDAKEGCQGMTSRKDVKEGCHGRTSRMQGRKDAMKRRKNAKE